MSLNGYSWVNGNTPNGAVGELIGLLNGYSYANGNPVNLTDHNGMCAQPTQWWNPIDVNCYYSAVGLAQRFSQGNSQAYNAWFEDLIQKDWTELKAIEALGSVADVTGASRQFLDNAAIIPRLFRENPQAALQALQQYSCQHSGTVQGFTATLVVASAQTIARFGSSGGGADPRTGLIGLAVLGGIVVAVGGLLAWDELTRPYEYRLSGFNEKVGTIAEHLAKVLGYEVAGYPPSGPNPDDRATRGWCVTIRNFIQQIDNTGYTERQLNRDLEAAGISSETWNAIKAAVRAATEKCSDHWGDFSGGSLAAS